MSAIGQPDFQRGVANAQILLATVAAGTNIVKIGIPPNAETLVVIFKPTAANSNVGAAGTISGVFYPTYKAIQAQGSSGLDTWFIDVSSALDTQANITVSPASSATWYVYADAGVHVTLDASKRVNGQGLQYVIPAPPSSFTGDHPPVELQAAAQVTGVSLTLVLAPGPGKRIRLFGLTMAQQNNLSLIRDGGTTEVLLACQGPGNATMPIPLTGYACSSNGAVTFDLWTSTGQTAMVAYFTTETI